MRQSLRSFASVTDETAGQPTCPGANRAYAPRGRCRTGASPASGGIMLNHSAVEANVPAADLDRAREYYSDKLGLTPVAEYGGGGLRDQNPGGGLFHIYKKQYPGEGAPPIPP